ncbi:hypothetical protein [Sphingomonas sp. PAMC 26605]|uniref:hypothetical protein n=1 Tax=Sphingomonas sp. PAMC 26605 TaxID=1112214 RepID=UPI00031153CA|nr:hypothetical protein [Sphingomonas sp. PAMC 26605]
MAIALPREHYQDFGQSFAAEKLIEQHDIRISHETLRKLMIQLGFGRPDKPGDVGYTNHDIGVTASAS